MEVDIPHWEAVGTRQLKSTEELGITKHIDIQVANRQQLATHAIATGHRVHQLARRRQQDYSTVYILPKQLP